MADNEEFNGGQKHPKCGEQRLRKCISSMKSLTPNSTYTSLLDPQMGKTKSQFRIVKLYTAEVQWQQTSENDYGY